jgi:hypothetical protein
MLILGLLLILFSAALTVGAVYDGGEAASVELLGASVDTTVAGVFFSGAATMLLFLVGVWLLMSSMGRARRKRLERKETRKRQRDSVARLEEERTQLRAENERLQEQLHSRPTTGRTAADQSDRTVIRPDGTTDTGSGSSPDLPPAGDTRATTLTTQSGAHARHETDLRDAEAARSAHTQRGQV